MMKFHNNKSHLDEKEFLVYPSNLAGTFDTEIAKQAQKRGARYGVGVGPSGRTYAIPVRDFDMKPLSLEQLKAYVMRFVKMTNDYPYVKWRVAPIRVGNLKEGDIAPLFRGCGHNVSFPREWEPYL